MRPEVSSWRMRRAHGVGDRPTRSARSVTLMRPSRWSTSRMRRSVLSSFIFGGFDHTVAEKWRIAPRIVNFGTSLAIFRQPSHEKMRGMARLPVAPTQSDVKFRGDYAHAGPDVRLAQNYDAYTADEHAIWRTLFERQTGM